MKKTFLIHVMGLFFSPMLTAQSMNPPPTDAQLLDIVKQQLTVMIVPDSTEKDGDKLIEMFENDPCFRTANSALSKALLDNGFNLFDFREALEEGRRRRKIMPNGSAGVFELAVDFAPVDVVVYLRKTFETNRNAANEHRVVIEIRAVNKYTAQNYATIETCFSNWMRSEDCSALVGQALNACTIVQQFPPQLTKRFADEGRRGRTVEMRLMPSAGGEPMTTESEKIINDCLDSLALPNSIKEIGTSKNIKRLTFRTSFYNMDTKQANSPSKLSISVENFYKTRKPEAVFKREAFGPQIQIEID